MTSSSILTEAEALVAIVNWSQACPVWQKDALRRLCENDVLNDADYVELYNICVDKKYESAIPLDVSNVRTPTAEGKEVTLKYIDNAQHVNALAPGEKLSFGSNGITIVYGDNGAGKSGYARILKSACRARSPKSDVVLPNLYSKDQGTPSARISFCWGDQAQTSQWVNGTAANEWLSSVSVFDSRTANVHVDQENDVAYTPFPLKLLELLVHACHELKGRIDKEIKIVEAQTPTVLAKPECRPHTVVGKIVASLDAKTSMDGIEELSKLSSEEQKKLEKLKADLSGDPSVAARQLLNVKNIVNSISDKIQKIDTFLSQPQMQHLQELEAKYRSAQLVATTASVNLFSREPLPDIGSDVWRSLWESARKYSQLSAYPGVKFPVTSEGGRCVLCQQELSTDAADRMNRFEDFIRDDSKIKEAEALKNYQAHFSQYAELWIRTSERNRAYQFINDTLKDSELSKDTRKFVIQSMWKLRTILRYSGKALWSIQDIDDKQEAPIAQFLAHSNALDARATALMAEKDSPQRKALAAEYEELADRVWLNIVKQDVFSQIMRKQVIAQLVEASKETVTNGITAFSKDIAHALVTNSLRAQFAKEVERLGVANLAIELRQDSARQGVPRFRVALVKNPSERVGNVLSEGEHRCIALAAFLAELITVEAKSAIVFDDPVSSLDHIYRWAVAQRLAEASSERQVIVFTHDIAFLFLLWSACKDRDVQTTFRSISRNSESAGICSLNPPPNAQPLPQVIQGMGTHLDNTRRYSDNGQQAEWHREVRSFQEQLRTAWERAVEDVLSPVIRRFHNKIDTKGLEKVSVVTADDCRKMRDAYARCSQLLHSEAELLNTPLPTPEKIKTEIDELHRWYNDLRGRQDTIQ